MPARSRSPDQRGRRSLWWARLSEPITHIAPQRVHVDRSTGRVRRPGQSQGDGRGVGESVEAERRLGLKLPSGEVELGRAGGQPGIADYPVIVTLGHAVCHSEWRIQGGEGGGTTG